MSINQGTNNDRIYFLDNIRYLMVLLVVALHAVVAYNYSSRWYVVDDGSKFGIVLAFFLNLFPMHILFFIAGYFSIPSIQKRKASHFLKNKFKHLGIPLLMGTFFLVPFLTYIYAYSRNIGYGGLWVCFIKHLQSGLLFYSGTENTFCQFNQSVFWFLSLLLLFFILFTLVYKSNSKLFSAPMYPEDQYASPYKSVMPAIFLTCILTGTITFFLFFIFPVNVVNGPQVFIANILMFQPSKFPLYFFCFCLGVYAYSRKWFVTFKIPGGITLWYCVSWFFLGFQEVLRKYLKENPDETVIYYLWCFICPFFSFSVLLAFLSFGIKFWNSSSKINRLLVSNSYNIYLIHIFFVVALQYFFLSVEISVVFKFFIITMVSILLSLFISHYVMRPYPRISAIGIIGLFIISLFIFI